MTLLAIAQGVGLLLRGLIRRHVDSVLLDPYANSFAYAPFTNVVCNINAWTKDNTTKRDGVTHARVNGEIRVIVGGR